MKKFDYLYLYLYLYYIDITYNMIIPMVCFSCGRPISHLWFQYLEKVKTYEIAQRFDTKNKSQYTPEFLALRDLHIGRMCCRRMFICQHDMYEKIK